MSENVARGVVSVAATVAARAGGFVAGVMAVAALVDDVGVGDAFGITAPGVGAVVGDPVGAASLATALSTIGGGADLDEKSRGVTTMTSAMRAAARSVRLSMQYSGKSSR
jgi:orotidine-5'-phosphate decarboxylase